MAGAEDPVAPLRGIKGKRPGSLGRHRPLNTCWMGPMTHPTPLKKTAKSGIVRYRAHFAGADGGSPGLEGARRMALRRTCPFLGVLDGDTLQVAWDGGSRLVRPMDVDPERAMAGGSKPATELGRRTLRWARDVYFKEIAEVLLEFTSDGIALSNSGKLLCYVHVNGDLYNVRLVREGWSPCFQKYGHPRIHRMEMERAEFWARFEGRGIWSGLGGRGDYQALKNYWQLRAGQIACYRLATAMGEDILNCRLDYADIVAAARAKSRIHAFVEFVRAAHLPDNSVVIQLGSPQQPFSAFFPPDARALAGFLEREHLGFGKPNYVYLQGTLRLQDENPQIVIEHPEQVSTCPPDTLK
jgi:micrococcal nuclease